MSTREADKKAQRAMAIWAAWAIVLVVIALISDKAPMWLRVLVGLLALVAAFFAGLVAIPHEKPTRQT